MSQIYTVNTDEVCPNCGEPQKIQAKINADDVGVRQYLCQVACGWSTQWEADPSVKPYIESQPA